MSQLSACDAENVRSAAGIGCSCPLSTSSEVLRLEARPREKLLFGAARPPGGCFLRVRPQSQGGLGNSRVAQKYPDAYQCRLYLKHQRLPWRPLQLEIHAFAAAEILITRLSWRRIWNFHLVDHEFRSLQYRLGVISRSVPSAKPFRYYAICMNGQLTTLAFSQSLPANTVKDAISGVSQQPTLRLCSALYNHGYLLEN
jgi:hypothetical protein